MFLVSFAEIFLFFFYPVVLFRSWSAQVLTTCRPCTAQLKASPLFRRFLTALVSRLCLTDCARHRRLDQAVAALLHTVLDLPDVGLDVSLRFFFL